MKNIWLIILSFCMCLCEAQVNIETVPDVLPVNIGGKKQVEKVVQTQMNMPDVFLKHPDKEVIIYFTVTKEGKVKDIFFKEELATFYKNESKRLLRYFIFEPAKKNNLNVEAYGSLTFMFSPSKYKSYLKERNRTKLSIDPEKADTSFVIYEAADRSPEYYKGEDALKEFILNELEYPNLARMQNIEGVVNLSFVVETNGFVSNIKATKPVDGGCTDEAIRIMGMTRWKPAEKGGKYVRYKTTYPITFSLKNVSRDNSAGGQ